MNKEIIIAQAKADKKRGLKLDPLNPDDLENVMMEYGYDDEELAIYKDAYFGSKVKEAFSYEDDEFFTREEVDDFAEKVCEHVNETFNEVFDVQESYITDNEIEVVVYNDDLGEFTGKKKVDMRRIKKPSDLDKYVLDIAADIIADIKKAKGLEESVKYPNGEEVTDIDLDTALDYQYGTDRDPDNSKYTEEEKQRAINYWLKKTDPSPYDESLTEDSDDDGPYSYEETEAELQSLTNNWTRSKDTLKCGYDEEKNFGMEILSKHGYECEAEKYGAWWEVTYWKEDIDDTPRFGKAKKAIEFNPDSFDEDVFKEGTIIEFKEDVLYGEPDVVAEAELDKYPLDDGEAEQFIVSKGFKMSEEEEGLFYIPKGTRARIVDTTSAGGGWPILEVNGIELEFAGDEPFKVSIVADSIAEAATVTRSSYSSRYTDYSEEDGWTAEDIAKHKEINWKERDYRDYPIPEDSFTGEAIAHTDNGTRRARVKFIKYIRSNAIFPPYYAPEKKPFTGVVGPMYDGNKHGSYDIHDRYESQDIYDALSR